MTSHDYCADRDCPRCADEKQQSEITRLRAEVEKLTKVRDDLMVAIGEALFVMDGLGRDTLRAALDAAKES